MITGAMFMAECLRHEGVAKVFGQCGHTNYALIDACHKLGIEYVSFRHEQMAAHAADAYFRVTHRLAVLNVHISPGMTNALGFMRMRRREISIGRSANASGGSTT
jgi:acetolactate synthase I/II/III large subunit